MSIGIMQTIDYVIIGIYLIATLALGMYKGWRVWDIADYAIGGKKYDTLFLTMTLFATIIGAGSTMGNVEQVFKRGLVYTFLGSAFLISSFLIAFVFVHHLPKFSNCLSIASVIGTVYGKGARILTGIFGFLYLAVLLGVQVKGLGYWMEALTGIPFAKGLFLVAGITILYASVGGIRGVTITDVLQFFLIIIGIPTICYFAVRSVGGLDSLFAAVPRERLNPFASPNFVSESLPFLFLFAIPTFEPHISQRLLMANSTKQARNSFIMLGVIEFAFFIMLGILGLVVYVRTPQIPASQAFSSIVLSVLPVGIKGLAIVGVLAVIMSTADSLINTSGVLFAHDVVNPLLKNRLNGYQQMLLARYTCVVIGILAIVVAFRFDDIFALALFRRIFWSPCLVIPVMATLLGYRTTAWRFYGACITGMASYFLWDKMVTPTTHISPFMPSILANAFVFLDFNSLKNSWKEKNTKASNLAQTEKLTKQKTLWQKLWGLVPNIKRLNYVCERNIHLNEAPWLLFGSFVLLNYIIPIFMWSPDYLHFRAAVTLRIISAFALSILLLQKYWPTKLQIYWPLYWHFILVFTLPFLAVFCFLDSPEITYGSLNIVLALLWLLFLVDGKTFAILSLIGISGGYLAHCMVNYIWPETPYWVVTFNALYPSLYLGAFSIAIAMLFIRKSRFQIRNYLHGVRQMSHVITNETLDTLGTLRLSSSHHGEMLLNIAKQFSNENVPSPINVSQMEIEASISQQHQLFKNILTTLEWRKATVENFSPDLLPALSTTSARTILQDVVNDYPFEKNEKSKVSLLYLEKDFSFSANATLLKWAIFHLLKNSLQAIAGTPNGRVILRPQFYKDEGWIAIESNAGNIDENILNDLLQRIDFSSKNLGIELTFANNVVKAMGGTLHCISEVNQFTRFLLLFKRVF